MHDKAAAYEAILRSFLSSSSHSSLIQSGQPKTTSYSCLFGIGRGVLEFISRARMLWRAREFALEMISFKLRFSSFSNINVRFPVFVLIWGHAVGKSSINGLNMSSRIAPSSSCAVRLTGSERVTREFNASSRPGYESSSRALRKPQLRKALQ